MASASSAATGRPVRIRSSARPMPTDNDCSIAARSLDFSESVQKSNADEFIVSSIWFASASVTLCASAGEAARHRAEAMVAASKIRIVPKTPLKAEGSALYG